MSKDIDRILDEEGAAAEDGEADQTLHDLPAHVKLSRPGRARSKVLQVRLNPEEYEALERIAARRDIPVSTVARSELLKVIKTERAATELSSMGENVKASVLSLLNKVGQVRDLAAELEGIRDLFLEVDLAFPISDSTENGITAALSATRVEVDAEIAAKQA